ncbi:phosphoribosyl-ATP diphosphatase [Rhodoplanes elegans]|uniref:Phosphoribosyl-ATP pyrophosphatase n=2 Tax=Rhodoplanes TaxID=29407 RepID=A0A327KB71_9BRAD|nr:phosphoribosyl-ATP diphosphatase [Rhodoplanes elegans]MBK5957496.1 phosphoribosyl-ATP diphosphatase [Rhodoplanes elegans]RAI35324.1 phosphoribosyl-ATP diphosphatase [Rhodoplanes elegans]
MSAFTLHDLEAIIASRAAASAETSYTKKLLDKGAAHCAKKMGEEAIEVVLAGAGETRDRVVAEAADLLYHLLVLLKARDISISEVEALLKSRTAQSGLDEKASRKDA